MSTDVDHLTLGPLMTGCVLNYFLFGCLVIQFSYYQRVWGSRDALWVRSVVYTLFTVELAFSVFLTHNMWSLFVERWGGDPNIQTAWTAGLTAGMNGFISCLVQMFFARRIWIISGKSTVGSTIAVLVILVSLLQGCAAFAFSVKFFLVGRDPHRIHEVLSTATVWLPAAAACDWVITITLVILFWRARGNPDERDRRSDSFFRSLIRQTIETGAITSFAALLKLICFFAFPQTALYSIFLFILGRL
ncbi:hypothetical protein AX16_003936 [Volvariella volvacea WC 439]|nr:hypothetical protein AX16_003936 [Volvariella volvacea WC 439]